VWKVRPFATIVPKDKGAKPYVPARANRIPGIAKIREAKDLLELLLIDDGYTQLTLDQARNLFGLVHDCIDQAETAIDEVLAPHPIDDRQVIGPAA
jgi:hypothetical protein